MSVIDSEATRVPNANVDESEVAKFEALAHRWWDKESEFKPLHEINPLRLNYIDEITGLTGKKVLDVGCGGGILSESMAQRGATVTGIDMGDMPIKIAKLHALESGIDINYRKLSAEDLADEVAEQPEQQFDVITCLEMLEHVPDPASIINACTRMLKPGGHLFLSTINRNPKAYLLAIIGAEYVLNLLPRGTHDYAKFIRPAELSRWVRGAGLEVKGSTGLVYNPLTKRYKLSERDVAVNYLMHTVKPV
ncbi:MAG: bifunctional 2-polyprenyl-6-hydroxyphenol methylase/3-demethylubiquinol 3-O-methyltransferase UbiG [Pseudomonadales bacterium]|jgi:2-polyprenyl-6-hydroxyphenyl methylase/3-demethylubiquinone-9 3-methyltransferase